MPSPPRSSIAAPTWDPARGQLGPLSRPSHGPVGGAHRAGAFAVVALRGNLSFSFMPHSTKQHESWACVSSPRFSSTTTTESMAPSIVDCRYCEDLGSSDKTRSSSCALLDCGPGCSRLGRSTKGHDSLKLSRTVSRAFDVMLAHLCHEPRRDLRRDMVSHLSSIRVIAVEHCARFREQLCWRAVGPQTFAVRVHSHSQVCGFARSRFPWAWLPLFQRGHFAT